MIRRLAKLAVPVIMAAAVLLTGCKKKTPAERLEEARRDIQERQTSLAIIKLEKLVVDAPEDPATIDARLILGQYFAGQVRQPARALPHFEEVFRRAGLDDQRGAQAFSALLQIHAGAGEFDKALALIDGTATRYAKEADIVDTMSLKRGEVLFATRKDEDTTKAIDLMRGLMIDSRTDQVRAQAREQLASYLRTRGDFDASNIVYDDYIAKHGDDPTTPQLVLAQAINLRLAGRIPESDERFAKGRDLMLAGVESQLNKRTRGQMLMDLAAYTRLAGDLDGAEKYMRRAMGENPMTRFAIEVQFQIAQMFAEAGSFDRAHAVLEQIQRENANTNISEQAKGLSAQIKAFQDQLAAQQGQTTGTLQAATPAPAAPAPDAPAAGS